MRKSFILHIDSLQILEGLTDEQSGQLFRKIYEYNKENKPKETQKTQSVISVIDLVFIPFKLQFDRDLEKYERVCERNKNNGKLGGRPKNENPKKPKKADSDNDSDSDSDNDSKNDNKKNMPTLEEFLNYAKIKISEINGNYQLLEFSVKSKYEQWSELGWVDGYGRKIKNWKTKFANTLPHLKPTQPQQTTTTSIKLKL